VSFEYLAAELALKLISIDFRLILLEEERFVIVKMFFEIGGRGKCLLTLLHCAFDDSWLSSLVEFHVLTKICGPIKAFVTQLAVAQENGVHFSPMHMQIILHFAHKQTVLRSLGREKVSLQPM
jgi:hypothetical protein